MKVLVDTNIFLNVARDEGEFAEGSEELLGRIQAGKIKGFSSCVVLMESKWALHEKKEYAKAERVSALIEEIVEILPIDKEIAKEAVDLKIRRKIELFDSIHVTTAIMEKAILVTRDEELKKKTEDLVNVKTPEEIIKDAL